MPFLALLGSQDLPVSDVLLTNSECLKLSSQIQEMLTMSI
jgi:hypothetical protein